MAQFDVYAPANGTALVVDIQSDVLDGLATRAVIPLVPLQAAPKPIIRLNPMMDVNGIAHSLFNAVHIVGMQEFKKALQLKRSILERYSE